VFDLAVADPTGPLTGLTIEGNPGLSWERDEELALRIDHGIEIIPDQGWANTEGAGGIVSAALRAHQHGRQHPALSAHDPARARGGASSMFSRPPLLDQSLISDRWAPAYSPLDRPWTPDAISRQDHE